MRLQDSILAVLAGLNDSVQSIRAILVRIAKLKEPLRDEALHRPANCLVEVAVRATHWRPAFAGIVGKSSDSTIRDTTSEARVWGIALVGLNANALPCAQKSTQVLHEQHQTHVVSR